MEVCVENIIAIQAGRVLTPLKSIAPGIILIEGEKIAAVGQSAEVPIPAGATVIDATDKVVIPGFVDTHIHGRDGHRFGEDPETTAQLCRSIVSTGVTGLLPTLGAQPTFREILKQIGVVRQVMMQGTGGAEILGIHMEGPYLSGAETARGSQEVSVLRQPSVEELHRMMEVAEGTIRKMSIAPELDGVLDVIREMVKLNIVPSAAHSAAMYEEAMEAVRAGLSCATHTFNGMIPMHHRKPGLLGAVLTCDEIRAELIPDGQHVGDVAMRVLLRCKGTDGVHFVTDNTVWAGMPNGRYEWTGGRTVVKEDNRVYVEGGTLAGSVAPMNFGVGHIVRSTGCLLAEAVKMASLNPALVIGAADRKGSLEPGKDADLVVIDEEVNVYLTMVKGQEVYRPDGG
jgi:N-acetylglucosamine-6-phosphate deacetylase